MPNLIIRFGKVRRINQLSSTDLPFYWCFQKFDFDSEVELYMCRTYSCNAWITYIEGISEYNSDSGWLKTDKHDCTSHLLNRNQSCVECSCIWLKCHWDQNFGIPYFCIFENSLWFFLVTMPNFNSSRLLEVAFSGRFLLRFYGRHYRPLFWKLACKLAEVTLEAHLKPSQASYGYLPREI